MPWNCKLQLDHAPAHFTNFDEWVNAASLAESGQGAGFVVGLQGRQIVTWTLRDAHRDVENLTWWVQHEPMASKEFCGARDQFLASISQSQYRAKAFDIRPELDRDKALGRPLTSRRILELACALDLSTAPPHEANPGIQSSVKLPGGGEDRSRDDAARWQGVAGDRPLPSSEPLLSDAPAGRSAVQADAVHIPSGVSPHPSSQYHSDWRDFELWCGDRQVSSWPASGETLAEYLRSLAVSRCTATVEFARTAISQTHRSCGLADPGATAVVRATLQDIPISMGQYKQRWLGRFDLKTPAARQAVRLTACTPRAYANRQEACHIARRRGLFDIALHSLFVETGLEFEQLANLQWRALQACDDGSARISVLDKSTSLHSWTVLSKPAYEDLKAIREDGKLDDRILPLSSFGLRNRFKAAAKAAGLLGQSLAGEAVELPKRTARRADTNQDYSGADDRVQPAPGWPNDPGPAAGAGTDGDRAIRSSNPIGRPGATIAPGTSTDRHAPRNLPTPAPPYRYKSAWRKFVTWCDSRGVPSWPASSETVVDHLLSRAESVALPTVWKTRTAIASVHNSAGLPDPCESRRVKETMRSLQIPRCR